MQKRDINCGHNFSDGFHYELDDVTTLWLCKCCNMNLASGVMAQLAIHTFSGDLLDKEVKEDAS